MHGLRKWLNVVAIYIAICGHADFIRVNCLLCCLAMVSLDCRATFLSSYADFLFPGIATKMIKYTLCDQDHLFPSLDLSFIITHTGLTVTRKLFF